MLVSIDGTQSPQRSSTPFDRSAELFDARELRRLMARVAPVAAPAAGAMTTAASGDARERQRCSSLRAIAPA
jgi:hypothetical protein